MAGICMVCKKMAEAGYREALTFGGTRWRLYWNDPRLIWNEKAWNVSSIVVPASQVLSWSDNAGACFEEVTSFT